MSLLDRISRRPAAPPAPAVPLVDPELLARRDRLVERFALQQSELGGLYYEMAIRDHIREDVLAAKAAELQRVDIELAQVERILHGGSAAVGADCPVCGTVAGKADVFCAQCGHPLQAPSVNGSAA
ncbi:MAG: hypothetical protein ACJ762_15780 [Solirubrobacteraceae bacterium]